MTDPTGSTVQATTSSAADVSLCDDKEELNDLHWIRDLVVKFKQQFPDLRVDFENWLDHLTNSESDFTKGIQNPSLNPLLFAVLVDYEILGKFTDALVKKDHFKEALRLCQIIFGGYKGFFGFYHPKTLQAQLKLASYLFTMKEYAQALDLNRKVYDVLQSSYFGPKCPDHELTITVQYNVASIFMHQNKCDEAQQLLQDILRRRDYFLGRTHPMTAKARAQLESCLFQLQKEDETTELNEKMLGAILLFSSNLGVGLAVLINIAKETESILGPDHLETLHAKYNVANSYWMLKQFKNANEIHRLVYDKSKKILSQSHVDTLNVHYNIGLNLLGLKDYAEALREFKLLYPLQEAALGADHEHTLSTLYKTALCLEYLKKYEEGLDAHKTLLQKQQRVLGNIHRETMETEFNIAVVLARQGKCLEALAAFQRVYEIQVEFGVESQMGTGHTKRILDSGRKQWALLEKGERLVCSICLVKMEFLQEDAVIMFECTHIFHMNCVVPLVEQGRSCPECRSHLNGPAVASRLGILPARFN